MGNGIMTLILGMIEVWADDWDAYSTKMFFIGIFTCVISFACAYVMFYGRIRQKELAFYVAQVIILLSAAQAFFHPTKKRETWHRTPKFDTEVHLRHVGGLVRILVDALCWIGLRKDWPQLP